jgi:hypothetical protein
MNWRRGLFRLWIVGTALFVIAIAFVSYGEIKAQFDATAPTELGGGHDSLLVPQFCDQARDVAGTDYSTQQERNPQTLTQSLVGMRYRMQFIQPLPVMVVTDLANTSSSAQNMRPSIVIAKNYSHRPSRPVVSAAGRGTYAICALPDLCFGIVSGRLGS